MDLVQAQSQEHLAWVRELFQEYADWLNFDLCFQDFDRELASLPGAYAPPEGRLLLAIIGGEAVACVALRKWSLETCEMKRLYVRPAFRGQGIGKGLAMMIVGEARLIGYERMRLDTVPSMTTAIGLYESLGFREIEPYRDNPIEGAKFMELILTPQNA